MRIIAILVVAVLNLALATADSYQEAYADSRGPTAESQSAKQSDRSPPATGSGAASPSAIYGGPLVQPNPAPVYGTPIRQQYGPPAQMNAQYGVPMYGPPTSLPSTAPSGPIFPDQGPPFNFDLLGVLQSIPLPDIQSVLKVIFKITLLKAVVKVISLFALILFAPKLEDIFNMIGMMTGVTSEGSSQDSDAIPSTMNDMAEEEEEESDGTPTKKPTARLRVAKEMRLDMMARALHDSINKTARELACRGDSCGFGLDSEKDKTYTTTGVIARMLQSLTGIPDTKKKPIGTNLKKSLKAVNSEAIYPTEPPDKHAFIWGTSIPVRQSKFNPMYFKWGQSARALDTVMPDFGISEFAQIDISEKAEDTKLHPATILKD